MKTRQKFLAAAFGLLASSIIYQPSTALGQGALTPLGSPTPTMLSLSQIEPRTPISAPITITQSGSYYLTTNITVSSGNAIQIEANNVKLDLSGFTISSTALPVVGEAIYIGPTSAVTNVTIIDGFISGGVTNNSSGTYGGSGFNDGIYTYYNNNFNVLVKNVSVSGCQDEGIYVGEDSSVVEACTASTVGYIGIYAQSVSDSTAANCGFEGINAQTANNSSGAGYYYGIITVTANNCYGYGLGNTYDYGMDTTTANNCYGYSNGYGYGVFAYSANNCYGYCSGSGYGLYISGTAIGCYGYSSSGVGIDSRIANSCMVGGGTTNITYKYNMP